MVDNFNRGDILASDIGKRIILPSSFTGGYRYMQQNFQDSQAICKEYGHPDLFITFTCNPKWDEIQAAIQLSSSHDASIRPDICARVFKMKLDAMIADLTKNRVMGRALAGTYFPCHNFNLKPPYSSIPSLNPGAFYTKQITLTNSFRVVNAYFQLSLLTT